MKTTRNYRRKKCPYQIGDRIRIINRSEYCEYRSELSYIVDGLDYDCFTLIARDINGTCGNWMPWDDCEPYQEIGWAWLKEQLPPTVVTLFSSFDGLENLTLRHDLRTALLQQNPSLKSCAIREAQKGNTSND